MTNATVKKENIYLELVYSFRSLVHFHHGRTWQQTGRHSDEEGTESPMSSSAGNRMQLCSTSC